MEPGDARGRRLRRAELREHSYLHDIEKQFRPDNLEIAFTKARDAKPFVATLNWVGRYMTLDSARRRAKAHLPLAAESH